MSCCGQRALLWATPAHVMLWPENPALGYTSSRHAAIRESLLWATPAHSMPLPEPCSGLHQPMLCRRCRLEPTKLLSCQRTPFISALPECVEKAGSIGASTSEFGLLFVKEQCVEEEGR
eukprot:g32743.t1